MRTWRLILILLAVAWVATVITYGVNMLQPASGLVTATKPGPGEVSVSIEPVSFAPDKSALTVSVTVVPDRATLDSTGGLVNPLGISLEPTLENGFILLAKGAIPAAFQRTLQLSGNVERYPFDNYEAPVVVAAAQNVNGTWQPLKVTGGFTRDSMSGWKFAFVPGASTLASADADTELVFTPSADSLIVDTTIRRTISTMAISTIVVILMAILAMLALFGVRAIAYGRRNQEMTMTGWFAAMIFALLPLRLALPGAPALGAWMDILVTFWVLIILLVSMAWWVALWLRGHGARK